MGQDIEHLLGIVLSAACNSRYLYALPMLVPLSIAAGPALADFPRPLARAMASLALALYGLAAVVLWAGWAALVLEWPLPLAQTLRAFRPGFVPILQLTPLLAAAVVSVGALSFWRVAARSVPLAWAAGATLAWALFFTLWLPYEDYGNSYRGMVAQLKARLPSGQYCIANRGLGEPQRAMLEYFAGIRTRSESSSDGRDCRVLLVQQQGTAWPLPPQGDQLRPLWSGARPGDVSERFWLFGSVKLIRDAELHEIDPGVRVAQAGIGKVLQP